MNKLLVLGGKPIGSVEIVKAAKRLGFYVVVADYLTKEQSPAKMIADECLDISTADKESLVKYIVDNGISGVYTAVHEFNIAKMIEICEQLNLPCFTDSYHWNMCNNKLEFKAMCIKHGINVAKEYGIKYKEEIESAEIDFPVIIKPVDGSGSRGFSICQDKNDLTCAFDAAVEFSESGNVIIEDFMNYHNSAIINYTIIDGEVIYGGISDKNSEKVFGDGAPIMSLQIYPSLFQDEYLKDVNDNAIAMFKDMGLHDGVVWVEAFCEDGVYAFNEMGHRFGGSLTYLPVKAMSNVDQLDLQIKYAMTGENCNINIEPKYTYEKNYCILPIHVKEGVIDSISGLEELKAIKGILDIVQVHFVGDDIKRWGSAQQVFAYIHFEVENRTEIPEMESEIMALLKVLDFDKGDLLFNLYNKN